MIPMNFMKSKAGFTLVELIVVIAILGILAGIAVPAYSGYIKKAETAGDTQILSAIYTAAASAYAAKGDVTGITVTCGRTTTGTGNSAVTTYDGNVVSISVTGNDGNLTGYTWEAGENGSNPIVGGDPDFRLFIGNGLDNNPDFKSDTYKKGATWSTANGWQPAN